MENSFLKKAERIRGLEKTISEVTKFKIEDKLRWERARGILALEIDEERQAAVFIVNEEYKLGFRGGTGEVTEANVIFYAFCNGSYNSCSPINYYKSVGVNHQTSKPGKKYSRIMGKPDVKIGYSSATINFIAASETGTKEFSFLLWR